MPKLDDTTWHLEGAGEPDQTAEVRGSLHVGLFLTWVIQRGDWKGLPGQEDAPSEKVRTRQMTGTEFLLSHCDGKLYSEMFTTEAAAFAEKYYPKNFLRTYAKVLKARGEQEYRALDTWQLYDAVAQELDSAFLGKREKPWWRPW